MKIGVISSQVFPVPLVNYGGLEYVAYETAKGLASRGHQVGLIAPDGSTCPGVTMIHSGPPGWEEKHAYGGIPNVRDGYWKSLPSFDVVIDHSWQKHSYMLKAEGVLKAPVLGVCHAPINTMFQSSPPPVPKPCIVCISNDQRQHYEALFAPHQARTAYNGVDLKFYQNIAVPRTDRFLFLARFSSIKGPDLAIDACLAAGVGLDMIGDTTITNEPELFQRCKAKADGKQIRVIGGVSRGECVWWMSKAKCLVHPNARFREPFGLAPVEAMACGLPVVSWNYGAMAETVGTSGQLVNSIDELVAAIKGASDTPDGIWEKIREGAVEQSKKFSIENMTRRYEELCEEALDTGGW